MLPPDWVRESGSRLSMSGFAAEFSVAWSRLERCFLKLECWQEYQEQESNRSHDAFKAGDRELATRLLASEAEADRSLYADVQSSQLEYARVRLVKLPLTSYLEYEFINYKIRAAMGENIEIVIVGSGVTLPSEENFDFLLFDDRVALVHDYGTDGLQVGGWLVEESMVVQRLQEHVTSMRARSVPLAEFLGGSSA